MKSLSVLIVEDEILIAETIRLYLEERGHKVTYISISFEEAIVAYTKIEPDVILLDIRLNGEKSGIDFANYINEKNEKIPFIYLTSQYDEKTLRNALSTHPSGYLSKPIHKQSLWTTIELVAHQIEKINDHIKIKINDGSTTHYVPENDISYIEADHVYVNVHLKNGKKIVSRQTLSNLEELFTSKYLIRCHRSYIVNLNFISAYTPLELVINDAVIPISRSRRQEIIDLLNKK